VAGGGGQGQHREAHLGDTESPEGTKGKTWA
jgi:hypothetical protein